MRLLRRESNGTFALHNFAESEIPAYAILSHRWGRDDQEIILQDLGNQLHTAKPGWRKLEFCADRVHQDGLTYFWIDTCCIDKTNLVELTESIISMFEWYSRASRCYVYLSDVSNASQDGYDHPSDAAWKSAFRRSQWFTRGWTLQELLAPLKVQFFSKEGNYLGDKESMDQSIHEITGIAIEALRGRAISSFSVEERLRWVDSRLTTRGEDLAYCLLGIFNVSMPVLYGEGKQKAFARLRREIEIARRNPESIDSVTHVIDEKTKLDAIRQSLHFDEVDDRYRNIAPHHRHTCQWLLDTAEYRSWLEEEYLPLHHGILWIKGKPGSGKSTITKFLFERHQQQGPEIISLSFFFSARGAALERTATGLYRSILYQLLAEAPTREWLSTSEWSDCHTKQWTIRRLQDFFETVILEFGERPLMLFIDALDECPEPEVREMITFFERLCGLTQDARINLRICFSSRHYPHISIRKSTQIVLESQTFQSDDIRRYVRDCLDMEPEEQANEIREEICGRASGVFMWVVLVVRILKEEYDHGYMPALRKKLDEIPDDLHALFSDIVLRDDKHVNQVSSCLRWIFHSLRPLTPKELYLAVLIDTQNTTLDDFMLIEEDISMTGSIARYIVSRSKGLAEITKTETPKVQFIHESVRDFLFKAHDLTHVLPWLAADPGSIHDSLKDSCVQYLEAVRTCTTWRSPTGLSAYLPTNNSLLNYATNHVFLHAEIAAENGIPQSRLVEEVSLEFWVKAYNDYREMEMLARNFRTRETTSLLYILSHLGCARLAGIEIKKSSSYDEYKTNGGYYRYPFFAALFQKHRDILATFLRLSMIAHQHTTNHECLRCTLDRDLSQLLSKSTDRVYYEASTTPFKYLLERHRPLAARYLSIYDAVMLNESYGASQYNSALQSTLMLPIDRGQTINHFFLEIVSEEQTGSRDGHQIAHMLLVYPEWEEYSGLLTRANVNRYDRWKQTALHIFSQGGHYNLTKFALGLGADPTAQDCAGQSALHHVAALNHSSLTDLLILSGADVEARDSFGRTPLGLAAYLGRFEAFRSLLSRGADVHAQTPDGSTIFQEAIRYGRADIVDLLQFQGTDGTF